MVRPCRLTSRRRSHSAHPRQTEGAIQSLRLRLLCRLFGSFSLFPCPDGIERSASRCLAGLGIGARRRERRLLAIKGRMRSCGRLKILRILRSWGFVGGCRKNLVGFLGDYVWYGRMLRTEGVVKDIGADVVHCLWVWVCGAPVARDKGFKLGIVHRGVKLGIKEEGRCV